MGAKTYDAPGRLTCKTPSSLGGTDGRTLILSRRTELTADQKILARQLKLDLPPQPPPRITAPEKIARLPANIV
jgi:hypothetical protein